MLPPNHPVTRIGGAIRRRSRFEPLRSAMLAVGIFCFVLSCAAVGATLATYAGWDERAADRTPRSTTIYTDEPTRLLWSSTLDYLPNETQFEVVYLDRLDPTTDLPPGLNAWPTTGQVALSPALAGALDAQIGDATRYGTFTGVIGNSGLMTPRELFAYIGADGRLSQGQPMVDPASGFGSDEPEILGAISDRQPLPVLLSLVVAFLLAPSVWLLANAIRIGAGPRARRVHIATLLGATSAQTRRLLWGEARLPWLLGTGTAFGVTAAAMIWNVPIPDTTFILQAGDLQSSWPIMGIAVLVPAVLGVAVCQSTLGLQGERPHHRRNATSALSWLRGAACPIAATVAVAARNIAAASGNPDLAQLLAIIGPVVTLALLPLSAVIWIETFARWARMRAHRAGDPSAMTGAAQVAARPRPPARFGATAAILIVATTVSFNVVINVISQNAFEAQQTQKHLGNTVALIQPFAQRDSTTWNAAIQALHKDYYVVELRDDDDGTTSLVGPTNDDLNAFVNDSATSQRSWLTYLAGPNVATTVGQPNTNQAMTLLVTPRAGAAINITDLRDALAAETTPSWTATSPGESWLSGARLAVQQAHWLTSLGVCCLIISLVALWASYSNELRRAIRALLAVQMLAPDATFIRRTLLWRIVAPISVAVAAGSMLAICLSIPRSLGGVVDIPYAFIGLCAAVAVGTGVIAWQVTWRACVRATKGMTFAPADE